MATYFDDLLTQEMNRLNGSLGNETDLLSEKKKNVADAAINKTRDIFGESSSRYIKSLEDGDSGVFMDNTGFRQKGYDTYETAHYGKLQDQTLLPNGMTVAQSTRNRLERQRQRYSKEFGVPFEDVTYDDIRKQGTREGLINLYNATKQTGDRPWTPGPISNDWINATPENPNPAQLGSDQNPLNIPVNATNEGEDKYKRQLTQLQNPATGENINEAQMSGFNATAFNGKRFDRQKAQTINDKIFYGNLTPEELSIEKLKVISGISDLNPDINNDGRAWSNIKEMGVIAVDKLNQLLDTGVEVTADILEKANVIDKKWTKTMSDYFNSSPEKWEKKFGLNTKYRDEATMDLAKKVEKGDYSGAVESVFNNLDVHLAESLPEIILLALKLPGLLIDVNARMKNFERDFKKINGREPTVQEKEMEFVTNAGVLALEQKILIGPLKTIFHAAEIVAKGGRTTERAITRSMMNSVGKSLLEKGKNVAATVGFEGAQEILDQTQEQYWRKGGSGNAEGLDAFTKAAELLKQGKVISPEEAIAAGIAGGVMGGVLRGGAESFGVPRAINQDAKKIIGYYQNRKTAKLAGEYLDETNRGIADMSIGAAADITEEDIQDIENARDEIVRAGRSEYNTFEELEKSNNKIIEERVRKVKQKTVEDHAEKIDLKQDEAAQDELEIKNDIMWKVANGKITKPALKKLGFEIKDGLSQDELTNEVFRQIDEKMSRPSFLKNGMKYIDPEIKEELFYLLDSEVINKSTKEVGGQLQSDLAKQLEFLNETANSFKSAKERIGKQTQPQRKSDSNLDVNTIEGSRFLDDKVTWSNVLNKIFTIRSTKKQIMNELNKYDDVSLTKAKESASRPQQKLIDKVLAKRKLAKKKQGIDNVPKPEQAKIEIPKDYYFENKSPAQIVKALSSQSKFKYFDSKESVDNFQKSVNMAKDKGVINEKQKSILDKRIEKIRKNTEENKKQKQENHAREDGGSKENKPGTTEQGELTKGKTSESYEKEINREKGKTEVKNEKVIPKEKPQKGQEVTNEEEVKQNEKEAKVFETNKEVEGGNEIGSASNREENKGSDIGELTNEDNELGSIEETKKMFRDMGYNEDEIAEIVKELCP